MQKIIEQNECPENIQISPELEEYKSQIISNIGKGEKLYRNMSVPERYYLNTLDNFIGFDEEIKKIKSAIDVNDSIFITGACGTGKTHVAVAIMVEWVKKNVKVAYDWEKKPGVEFMHYPCFLPSVELFLRLKNSFDKDGDNEHDIITEYSNKRLLVVDDLGAEKISDWSRQVFYTLIDRRFRTVLPTIITTNLDLEKISSLFDDRLASRIVGSGVVITLKGKDWRLNK